MKLYQMRYTCGKAADILARHRWCQEMEAIDRTNQPCTVLSPQAAGFCAVGAIKKAMENTDELYGEILARIDIWIRQQTPFIALDAYNDHIGRNKKEVIEILRRMEKELQ